MELKEMSSAERMRALQRKLKEAEEWFKKAIDDISELRSNLDKE